MTARRLLVISGGSGVGKSTLARAVQDALLPAVWLHLSVDTLFDCLPRPLVDRVNRAGDHAAVDGRAVAQAARACVRTLLDLGHQVIFDAVLVNETGARSLLEDFRDHAPLHVALTCSWQEIERRTRARGDRTLAEARHGFCHAGPHGGPDLAFDTTGLAPDGIVADVVAALRCGR